MALRILVADKLADEGLDFLKQSGIEFDTKVGLGEGELAAEVPNYDGLIVRSGAKVTAKVLEKPGQLKCIARAGVGVDNIDLEAATARGILVMNTASASTVSTAEHALALMFSLARNIPAASAKLKSGQLEWKKRSSFKGKQLAGRTLGVVGMGRIGRTVAERALALGMTVIGFDPYFSAATALDGRVKMFRDLDEFFSQIDVVTFHVPGGEGTKHLLDRRRLFEVVKKDLLIVNDSRGDVVDEEAVAEALKEGRIAGAALDVYHTEPPRKDHPLFALDNAVLTPHLGASTEEAQTAVSLEACEAVVAYLKTGEIRGAVNAGGIKLDLAPDEAPFAELAKRIGTLLAGYCQGGYKSFTLRASGTRAPKLMNTLMRLAAVELLKPHLSDPANVINVEHIAHSRGIELIKVHEPQPPQGMAGDVLGIRVNTDNGESHRIQGTVYADSLPRVLRIDGYNMDMVPEGHMVLIENKDQPGVIGAVGSAFGNAGVNIADMVISRDRTESGASALMLIKVDTQPDDKLVAHLRAREGVIRVKRIDLPSRE